MKTHGGWSIGWLAAAAVLLWPLDSGAVSITSFRDLVDPVPPGGTLTYRIRVNPLSDSGIGTFCFNPDPECITMPATCLTTPVNCVGDSFTGFQCVNSLNNGADCGVGDPPLPDFSLCVPNPAGICDGGINAGLPCSSNADCPGNTYICQFAFNEGDFCGTGNPPVADSSLCIPNQSGFCNGGPNFLQPCDAPHGVPTDQCPPDDGEAADNVTSVTMSIPSGTTFISATHGGTSDGSLVSWELPNEPCSGPDGVSGTPPCPELLVDLAVSSALPVGTILESEAIATDPFGLIAMRRAETTVGTFKLLKYRLFYPTKPDRDRFTYRVLFTLGPGLTLMPEDEVFRMQMTTTSETLVDLQLDPGQLRRVKDGKWRFTSREPGIRSLVLAEKGPSHYRLTLRAAKMDLPDPNELDVSVTLTFGNDVLTQPLSLLIFRGGKKFIAVEP